MKTHFGANPGLRWVAAASLLMLATPSVVVAQQTAPTATFDAVSLIRDTQALLPLMDYVPLFSFNMKYIADTPAPRDLESLTFTVSGDHKPADQRPYAAWRGPNVVDLLDFAIFRDNPTPGPVYNTLGNEDEIVATFDNTGYPLGDVNRFDQFRTTSPLTYVLDKFAENGIELSANGSEDGANYIMTVRTSALWHHSMTLGVSVNRAFMINPFGPIGEDSYPNNNWEESVSEEVGYSASFSVFDYSSAPRYDFSNRWANAWNHPYSTYTPLAEHARPRWDLPAQTFEVVFGEALGLRRIFPVETWVPLLGINAHSTAVQHELDRLRPADPDYSEDSDPTLREVNVTLVDVGGKAGTLAGSGGFDPRKHLNPMTASGYYIDDNTGDPNNAIGIDYTYNGLWVFYDTNGNGVFDPPVPGANGGAALVDHPLLPDWRSNTDQGTPDLLDRYKERWQYIDNPPDGGDPWWRVKLRFFDGRRRGGFDEAPTGFLEPTPDNVGPNAHWSSEITPDFFVVSRADSGFQDASLVPGDGTGYLLGADFKAMIEPRWFDPVQGHWQGGIHISTQIPGTGLIVGDRVLTAWQDDPRWYQDEPWWTQRTSNAFTTKPVRGGVEVHDYTLLYESNSGYATNTSEIFYASLEGFNAWMDPTGALRQHFYYGFSADPLDQFFSALGPTDAPVPVAWHIDSIAGSYQGVPVISDGRTQFSFPFETAPFFKQGMDGVINGPRSPVYLFPPAQPTLPTYDTWPANLAPGRYPAYSDWEPQYRRARLLKQHIEINSLPTPLLGINLVGADDPVVNRVNARLLNEIYVAFWGPDFTKTDLKPLQLNGLGTQDTMSGVQLRYDSDEDGTYSNPLGFNGISVDSDPPLELKDLAWPAKPEHVDLDGDELADDLDGDGVVTDKDVAWVLRLIPLVTPLLPKTDSPIGNTGGGGGGGGGGDDGGGDDDGGGGVFDKSATVAASLQVTPKGSILVDLSQPGALDAAHEAIFAQPLKSGKAGLDVGMALESSVAKAAAAPKALPLLNNAGDDMFITVRTSATLGRFEKFRAFIPATLPDRVRTARLAGIKITPSVQLSAQALEKSSQDEGPVQDYYYHDLMETNMPVVLHSTVGDKQTISRQGDPLAVLGVDVSTNRGATAGVAAEGTNGTGAKGSFAVSGATWTANAFTGYFLIDRLYKAYEITGNTDSALTLLTNLTPANGKWFIAKDPTFLEQLIVEFYDEGGDGQFSILDDLLPLDKNDLVNSGVIVYRDNDNNPGNVNGKFDEGDIPVELDADPQLIGEAGEVTTQVKFVFSSPGTDNVPVPRIEQDALRQWVPDTFSEPHNGDDFFVVVRAAKEMTLGDDFSVGLVSWGPDTPTQPDADTFVRANVPEIHKDGLAQYLEFPWGSRALGFITYFKTPPDNSGVNWIRTTVAQNIHTKVVKAAGSNTGGGDGEPTSPTTISSVTPSVISITTPATGTAITVTGEGFGDDPLLRVGSVTLEATSASDTEIVATIPGGTEFIEGPVTVFVQNSETLTSATETNLLEAIPGEIPDSPLITDVTPETGEETDFPVTIRGEFFVNPEVYFGSTKMPVAYVDPNGRRIDVNFPSATGLATGPLDVQVKSNHTVDGEKVVLASTLTDGFYFKNNPGGGPQPPCFIATAAYGTPFGQRLDTFRSFRDGVLLQTAPGTAFVDLYYSMSPPVAKVVAVHPWLAALVRMVLTPVAWLIEQPAGLAVPVAALWLSLVARRRRAKA